MPSGSRDGSSAATASSAHVIARSGAPATSNRPSSGSVRSASSTSNRCEASVRAFAATAWLCSATAEPPTCRDLEPHVPAPRGTTALSEWTTRTLSNGTPRIADAICAIAVSCPCPCGETPVSTVTVPSACTSTEPNSFDANAVIST